MRELRDRVHTAALAVVQGGTALDKLLTRSQQRSLVRDVRDWYLDAHAGAATTDGTCIVVTAGAPGAGKTPALRSAVADLGTRFVIDPDVAKEYLAHWCIDEGIYSELLTTEMPDGLPFMPLELSPVLQTMSTEACNAVRRVAFAAGMDVVIEATMASPAYGERLLQSLAKADYEQLLIVSVETDRATAHERAISRWWTGRQTEHQLGGRLVLPSVIDALYPTDSQVSVCRDNARSLLATIRAGGSSLENASLVEYGDDILTAVDADPPRAVDNAP